MVMSAVFSFLHFAAVFGIVGTLVAERVILSPTPTYREATRLQQCDRWYGLSAMVLLIVGFLRVYYFEKGSAFYFANPFFQAKLGLFIAVGLLSIYPTVRFVKWRAAMKSGAAPTVPDAEYRTLRTVLRLELILLAAIVACAAMMARGVGLRPS
jgi:putative membrane protein